MHTHAEQLQLLRHIPYSLPELQLIEGLYKEAAESCKVHPQKEALASLRTGYRLVQARMEQLGKEGIYDRNSMGEIERD